MTPEEIEQRIQALQQQINQLAAMLPDDTTISFGTRFNTQPSAKPVRKELVISLNRSSS